MKRVFPRQSQALALMLALSVTVVTPCVSQALSWNPVNWMPAQTSSSEDAQAKQAAQTASQQAEAAQKAAEEALKQAKLAKERADQARQAADALNPKSAKKLAKAHNTVTTPTATRFPVMPAPASAPDILQTSQGTPSMPDTTEASSDTEALKLQIAPSVPDANPEETTSSPQQASNDLPSEAQTTPTTSPDTVDSSPTSIHTGESSKAADNAHRGSALNPTHWLYDARHDTFKEKQAEKESLQQASIQTPDATKQGNRAPWNPMSWFGSGSATPQVEAPRAEQQESAQEQADTSVGSASQSEKSKAALIETEKGNIAFEFYPDAAPETVHNFIKLANDGFYNKFNMRFHRVIPGFVIQTGDPTGTGAGGSKDRVPLEVKNKLSHNAKGVVAMARGADPNSGTSQFYITLAPQTSLDGKYTIFGRVIGGMDVLDKIEKGDMMYGVKIVDLNTITRDPQPEKKSFFSSLF